MTLDDLNRCEATEFVAALDGAFEHSPWVAEAASPLRPFATIDALHKAMVDAVGRADRTRQVELLRAHPDLAGRAALEGTLTEASRAEQDSAGLTRCAAAELATLHDLNARYKARFGFPFILAVRGHDRAGVLAAFSRRVEHEPADELAENLRQVARIAALRLAAMFQS